MMKFQKLSVSLGAADHTNQFDLSVCFFCRMEEKNKPNLISRIQDRRGKTIFQVKIESVLVVKNL